MRSSHVITILIALSAALLTTGCGTPPESACVPEPEQCNGVDDDCDGLVDEDDTGVALQRDCSSPCGVGSEVCAGGEWMSCTAPLPATELCDGLDNDCDGETDEGFECALGAQELCGSDVGECAPGTRICGNECKWGDCVGGVTAGTEVCEGSKDEDCDGTVDDGCTCTNGTTRACCGGAEILCQDGRWPVCPALPAEACNGLDDDCDGDVDEGLPADPYQLGESITGLDDCDHAEAVGTVLEGAGPASFTSYLYKPDLSPDRDYFLFAADEAFDFSCIVAPLSYECYTLAVRLDDASVAAGYDVCVYDVGFEGSSATCDHPEAVACASDEEPRDEVVMHWQGNCGLSDLRYLYLEVLATPDSGGSCRPYRLTLESYDNDPQEESCSF